MKIIIKAKTGEVETLELKDSGSGTVNAGGMVIPVKELKYYLNLFWGVELLKIIGKNDE